MKHLYAIGLLCITAVITASGQDGLFGSFLLGQKFINVDELNAALTRNNIQGVEFPSHHWSLGGEGHVVIAKHFVVGGKGFAFTWEKAVPGVAPERRLKLTGGTGIGNLGYALNVANTESHLFRIIPQAGLGLSTFLFQSKTQLDSTQATFNYVLRNGEDNMTVIEKVGLVIDVAISVDWYLKFIHLLSIVPGLETGPMLHLDCGYSITPANLHWMRDVDQLDYDPDLKFNGFYVSAGIGLGFSSGKN